MEEQHDSFDILVLIDWLDQIAAQYDANRIAATISALELQRRMA